MKIAIVTQSYKNDYNECRLLCESIDIFASQLEHFIFVNDEDFRLFKSLEYGHHHLFKKSTILPHYMVRIPFKILGHHFHVSPFTIPVREWIVQQICKLGAFEVVGNEYDALFNIDSETVFMKPFGLSEWVKDGKCILYRVPNVDEPSHDDYVRSAIKLLGLPNDPKDIGYWNYMNTPVCFVRENTEKLLKCIKDNSKLNNWKLALCNTYRFSEYYTYGIYTDKILEMRNHFVIDYHIFPQIDISECEGIDDFKSKVKKSMSKEHALGLWLQKKDRKLLEDKYLDFKATEKVIKEYWNNQ